MPTGPVVDSATASGSDVFVLSGPGPARLHYATTGRAVNTTYSCVLRVRRYAHRLKLRRSYARKLSTRRLPRPRVIVSRTRQKLFFNLSRFDTRVRVSSAAKSARETPPAGHPRFASARFKSKPRGTDENQRAPRVSRTETFFGNKSRARVNRIFGQRPPPPRTLVARSETVFAPARRLRFRRFPRHTSYSAAALLSSL